jgi:metal-responsive CopG/Arc/MetJ family transcriptional regulator
MHSLTNVINFLILIEEGDSMKKETKNKVVMVRLPTRLYEEMERIAGETYSTNAEIMRRALVAYVLENKAKKEKR